MREGPGHSGLGSDEEDGAPHRSRNQLFISPSGKPFRAPVGQPYPSATWFAEADADHDGRLTRDEFRADADAYFKVLDTNGDGQISMIEVTHWEEDLVPELGALATGNFGGRAGRGAAQGRNELDTRTQGAALFSLINEPHPIRGADADFSFTVGKAEWRAASDRRFDLLDADHDGVITLAELKQTPAQRFGGRGPQGEGDGGGQGPRGGGGRGGRGGGGRPR